jgi:hypothetical protein
MKTPPAKQKPRTHFEQISVAEAKKIAEQQESKQPRGPANVIVEPNSRKTEPYSMSALSPDRTGLNPYRQWYGHRPVMSLATQSPE